jgi:hypothetical protein
LKASIAENIELVLAIESDQFSVDEIELWIRSHIIPTAYRRENENP